MEGVILNAGASNSTADDEFFYEDRNSFWNTRTGHIVRTSIFFGILLLFGLYMLFGYIHAKKRINKGLPPLAYHRWLLNRQQRAPFEPSYQNPNAFYSPYNGNYGMHSMQNPPPVYDANGIPPTYQPPMGGSKIDPYQSRGEPTRRPQETGEAAPEYEPPAGPPPAAMQANHTGNTNPFRG